MGVACVSRADNFHVWFGLPRLFLLCLYIHPPPAKGHQFWEMLYAAFYMDSFYKIWSTSSPCSKEFNRLVMKLSLKWVYLFLLWVKTRCFKTELAVNSRWMLTGASKHFIYLISFHKLMHLNESHLKIWLNRAISVLIHICLH